jgi:phosphohistidine phosphatase
MRRLTLIRHAKSSWDDPELTDFERPLNARGRRDAPEMAQRTKALGKPPLQLISSPALRAITTARIFAEVWRLPLEDIVIEPRLYDASSARLLQLIGDIEDEPSHAIIVAHNPGLSELCHALASCPFRELPTTGVVSLNLNIERWSAIAPDSGHVEVYRYPKE